MLEHEKVSKTPKNHRFLGFFEGFQVDFAQKLIKKGGPKIPGLVFWVKNSNFGVPMKILPIVFYITLRKKCLLFPANGVLPLGQNSRLVVSEYFFY